MTEKYYIYIHINKINNKTYIGQTNNPNKRWRGKGVDYKPRENSESLFYKAIQKYGWDNFEHKILAECETREEANELEKQYILEYDSTNPEKGYNLSSGGDVRDWYKNASKERQEEYKEKRRKISHQLWQDEEYKRKQREGLETFIHTQEYKDKMRESILKRNAERPEILERSKKQSRLNGQPIQCIETGEIFACITEATEAMGGSPNSNSINHQLSGKNKTAYGYTWKRISKEEFLVLKDEGYYHGDLYQ